MFSSRNRLLSNTVAPGRYKTCIGFKKKLKTVLAILLLPLFSPVDRKPIGALSVHDFVIGAHELVPSIR